MVFIIIIAVIIFYGVLLKRHRLVLYRTVLLDTLFKGNKRTALVIVLGDDFSFPQKWRSVGFFISINADVDILFKHFIDAALQNIVENNTPAVDLTGYYNDATAYSQDDIIVLCTFFRNINIPVCAICGGHKFPTFACGVKLIEMGSKEKGYVQIAGMPADPVFCGISGTLDIFDWHRLLIEKFQDYRQIVRRRDPWMPGCMEYNPILNTVCGKSLIAEYFLIMFLWKQVW